MKRGTIVILAARGAYTAKPRPWVIVQSDLYNETHASITACPITSTHRDAPYFRIHLPAGARTGLELPSQVMVDKIASVPREAIGRAIGHCSESEIDQVDDALRSWLGL